MKYMFPRSCSEFVSFKVCMTLAKLFLTRIHVHFGLSIPEAARFGVKSGLSLHHSFINKSHALYPLGYTETSKNECPLPSAARSQGKHAAPSAWGLWKGQLRTPESQGVRALGQQRSIRVDFSLRAGGDAAGCSCTFSRHPSPNLSRVSQPWSIRTLYSGDLPLLLNSTGCWKQLAGHDP